MYLYTYAHVLHVCRNTLDTYIVGYITETQQPCIHTYAHVLHV